MIRKIPSRRAWLAAVTAALVGTIFAAGLAHPAEIVSWATNTPAWNQQLGVTMMRQGCSSAPVACLGYVRQAAVQQNVERWTIAVKGDLTTMLAYAAEYSRLSMADASLVQVDIDDFVALLKRWNLETVGSAAEVFSEFSRSVKSANPDLGLGITLYEDELDSRVLQGLSEAARAQVDRVSLYLHYRANAEGYPRYVDRVKELFPRAAIWAGSYAYDRTDYLPCAQDSRRPCSMDEELRLFQQSLGIQLELLSEGKIAGIEFYPGHFGLEREWHGWAKPRICQAERREACIAMTRRMRQFVCDSLEKCRGG
jgi:hypothetical protein